MLIKVYVSQSTAKVVTTMLVVVCVCVCVCVCLVHTCAESTDDINGFGHCYCRLTRLS